MQRDSTFWLCMVVNMLAIILLAFLKPLVHQLPPIIMHIIIKIELIMQITLGFYGLWVSTDKELFWFSAKTYGFLLIIYVLLKIPALSNLNGYFIVVPAMFSPLPFVIAWMVDKSFYRSREDEKVLD